MTGWADFSPWRAHQLIHMFALGLPLALIIQRGWSPLARANCSPVKIIYMLPLFDQYRIV